MADWHVDFVLVCDGERAVGIVPDRDLVVRLTNDSRNPSEVAITEVMDSVAICISKGEPFDVALLALREIGVRWLPVADADGKIDGLLDLDEVADRFYQAPYPEPSHLRTRAPVNRYAAANTPRRSRNERRSTNPVVQAVTGETPRYKRAPR